MAEPFDYVGTGWGFLSSLISWFFGGIGLILAYMLMHKLGAISL